MWKHRLLYWWKRTCRYTLGPPPCICSSSRVTRLTITIIILSNELVQLRIYYLGQGAFQPRKADDTEGTRLAKLSRLGSQSKHRIRFTLPARGTSDVIWKELSYQLIYLTIIPRLRVGFEMVDHLISNKRQWNNCFIKNANKISRILPDFTWKNSRYSDCF